MERVYLLLRNNQQSGPFTIGELLQQQLRVSDMIWIEGKSTAWTYLSELELNTHISESAVSDQSKSLNDEDEIERKAEELRQRVLSSSPKVHFSNHIVEVESYASPYKLPEEEIRFVDHRRERKNKKASAIGELFLTCLVIGLFLAGIYKGKSFLGARDKIQNSVANQLTSGDEHAARKSSASRQVVFSYVDTAKKYDSLLAAQKAKQKPTPKKTVIDSVKTGLEEPSNTVVVNQENKKEDAIVQTPLQVPPENAVKKNDTPIKKEIVSSKPEIKNNEPGKEEKKGFLRGLFKKKKKDSNSTGKE